MKKSVFLIIMGICFLFYTALAVMHGIKGDVNAAVGYGCAGALTICIAGVSIDARDYRERCEAALNLNKDLSKLNEQIISEAQDVNRENREILQDYDKLLKTIDVLKEYIPGDEFQRINTKLNDTGTVFSQDEEGDWLLYYKKDIIC